MTTRDVCILRVRRFTATVVFGCIVACSSARPGARGPDVPAATKNPAASPWPAVPATVATSAPAKPATREDQFGYALAVLDDLDADGVCELAVSDPSDFDEDGNADRGRVFVVSTPNAKLLYTFAGSVPSARLGERIVATADLDADGARDFCVTERVRSRGSAERGARTEPMRVSVRSGRTGVELFEIHTRAAAYAATVLAATAPTEAHAWIALSPAADPGPETSSCVEVHDLRTRRRLVRIDPPRADTHFGGTLAFDCSVDSERIPLAIGSSDGVRIVDARTGREDVEHEPRFDRVLGWGSDADQDGVRDLWVGERQDWSRPTTIALISGRGGSLLLTIEPSAHDRGWRPWTGTVALVAGERDTLWLGTLNAVYPDYLGGLERVTTGSSRVETIARFDDQPVHAIADLGRDPDGEAVLAVARCGGSYRIGNGVVEIRAMSDGRIRRAFGRRELTSGVGR